MAVDSNTQIIVARQAVGPDRPMPVSTEGSRSAYGYAAVAITPAATPTDIVTLYGSATKTVRVKKVTVSGVATTAGSMDVSLVKRTAANTAGTTTNPTPGKLDSTSDAATATLSQYSANPSAVGTGIAIRNKKLNFGLAGAAGVVEFDFSRNNDKPLILRGATQGMAINLNGQAVPAGGALSYDIEFEESDT
ncbi:MAG TPA: hypothetical protein DCZ10_16130 [Pelotomaculum sp.]|nr:hypothetical protein [Pelotomaculum sp.]